MDKILKVYLKEDLEPLIPRFMDNRKKDLISMRESLEKCDFSEISRLSHSLIGVAGSFGFTRLEEIARGIQASSQIKDSQSVRELLQEADQFISEVKVIYV